MGGPPYNLIVMMIDILVGTNPFRLITLLEKAQVRRMWTPATTLDADEVQYVLLKTFLLRNIDNPETLEQQKTENLLKLARACDTALGPELEHVGRFGHRKSAYESAAKCVQTHHVRYQGTYHVLSRTTVVKSEETPEPTVFVIRTMLEELLSRPGHSMEAVHETVWWVMYQWFPTHIRTGSGGCW